LDGVALNDKDKERVNNENTAITKELLIENLKNHNKNVDYGSTLL
jgi:hypothetical protein